MDGWEPQAWGRELFPGITGMIYGKSGNFTWSSRPDVPIGKGAYHITHGRADDMEIAASAVMAATEAYLKWERLAQEASASRKTLRQQEAADAADAAKAHARTLGASIRETVFYG